MATLSVSKADFQSGRFPEVCALTGYLAESQYRIVAAGSPLLAGAIPLSTGAAKGLQQRKSIALIACLVGVGLVALGLLLKRDFIFIAGFVSLAVGVTMVRRLSKTVTARVIGDEVRLDGVHDDFVIAITRPAKCADCPGKSTCSITEMQACDEHGQIVGSAHT